MQSQRSCAPPYPPVTTPRSPPPSLPSYRLSGPEVWREARLPKTRAATRPELQGCSSAGRQVSIRFWGATTVRLWAASPRVCLGSSPSALSPQEAPVVSPVQKHQQSHECAGQGIRERCCWPQRQGQHPVPARGAPEAAQGRRRCHCPQARQDSWQGVAAAASTRSASGGQCLMS